VRLSKNQKDILTAMFTFGLIKRYAISQTDLLTFVNSHRLVPITTGNFSVSLAKLVENGFIEKKINKSLRCKLFLTLTGIQQGGALYKASEEESKG